MTPGAFQTSNLSRCNFISILSPDATSFAASTLLSGLSEHSDWHDEVGNSIAIDSFGLIYITGSTYTADFPITPEIFPSSYSGEGDSFVSIFSGDLSQLILSFYLGGDFHDRGTSIALQSPGIFYVSGYTGSTDFPVTPGAFQDTLSSGYSAYVTKVTLAILSINNVKLVLTRISE